MTGKAIQTIEQGAIVITLARNPLHHAYNIVLVICLRQFGLGDGITGPAENFCKVKNA